MGFIDRFKRGGDGGTLVAAAEVITDEQMEARRGARPSLAEWQRDVWDKYDAVPEVWFSTNYVANALRRVNLFPAIQPDPMQPPIRLDPATDGPTAARANAELARLQDEGGTYGGLMHGLAMQLTLPGEANLALYSDADTGVENCIVASVDELQVDDSGRWVLLSDGATGGATGTKTVLEDAVVSRIWREHPHYRSRADSPMRPLLGTLEELDDLDANARGAAKSRIGTNGVWMVPDEINFKRDPRLGARGHGYSSDPFVDTFIHMGVTAMRDDSSAARAIPGVLKVKGDRIEQFKYEAFGRSFTEEDANRYQVLLRRYAGGIDLPLEVVLGIEDLNHWNAWMIPEESFSMHLAPLVETICGALTKVHMRPALADVDQSIIVWYDASAITSRPGRGAEADAALELGGIGYEAYRRYRGYRESDAPTPEDIALLKDVQSGSKVGQSQPAQGPPQSAVTSSASDVIDVSDIGHELTQMDRQMRTQLQAAARDVVNKALEKAGAKLRVAAVEHEQLAAAIETCEDRYVCAVLGEPAVRYFFETNDEIIHNVVDPLIVLYGSLVLKAQKRLRTIALQHGTVDSALVAKQDEDRSDGARALKSALKTYIGEVLFSPDSKLYSADFNVFGLSTTLTVPTGIIREALAVAGGAANPVTIDPVTGEPTGGVTTGSTAGKILEGVGIVPVSWTWMYGDVGSREKAVFQNHLELDGVEFLDWTDPQLAVQAGDEWLNVDFYFPGDHDWCQCDYEARYDKVEGDGVTVQGEQPEGS